jgi:hypothetical protein
MGIVSASLTILVIILTSIASLTSATTVRFYDSNVFCSDTETYWRDLDGDDSCAAYTLGATTIYYRLQCDTTFGGNWTYRLYSNSICSTLTATISSAAVVDGCGSELGSSKSMRVHCEIPSNTLAYGIRVIAYASQTTGNCSQDDVLRTYNWNAGQCRKLTADGKSEDYYCSRTGDNVWRRTYTGAEDCTGSYTAIQYRSSTADYCYNGFNYACTLGVAGHSQQFLGVLITLVFFLLF